MPKRIGIMIGSDSDLPQCYDGLKYLEKAEKRGRCEVVKAITNSIHRNTEEVLENLKLYNNKVDIWIIGAGWANHLTGTCDAYLRYTLKNTQTVVFGVAFSDPENELHTITAEASIIMVPATQVVYDKYIGAEGFLRACVDAVEKFDKLPKIKIGAPKPVVKRTLKQAIEAAKPKK